MPKHDRDQGKSAAETARVREALVPLSAAIVSSYVAHNQVPAAELPVLIVRLHTAIAEAAGQATGMSLDHPKPAVPIKKSIGDTFLICLEDGKRLTMLKRYLRSQYGMSPEQYRAKWGLPADYPMVAPAYARLRSAFAKKIGLGSKRAASRKRIPKSE